MFFLWWLRINLLKGVIYDTINTTRRWKNNTLFFLLFLILVKTIYRFPGLRCHSSKQKALMKYKSYWHCFCLSFYFLQKRFIFGSCLNYGLPLRQRYQSKLGKHVYFLFLDTHKKSNIKKELTLLFSPYYFWFSVYTLCCNHSMLRFKNHKTGHVFNTFMKSFMYIIVPLFLHSYNLNIFSMFCWKPH